MSKVAQLLQAEDRQRLRSMTPAERLAEALALGRRAVAMYASAHGVSEGEARRVFERAGQAGRRYSRVMREMCS